MSNGTHPAKDAQQVNIAASAAAGLKGTSAEDQLYIVSIVGATGLAALLGLGVKINVDANNVLAGNYDASDFRTRYPDYVAPDFVKNAIEKYIAGKAAGKPSHNHAGATAEHQGGKAHKA